MPGTFFPLRLVMEPQARFSGVTPRSVVEEVLKKIPVPA